MKTAYKAVIILCILIILSVLSFLVIYFHKPAVSTSSNRGSLHAPQPALKVSAPQIVSGNPSFLSIPSLNKSLSIIPGTEDSKTGAWTLTWDKVQYATISPEPNNHEGNTLIYGHETSSIFTYLYRLRPGDTASVTTDNGYIFHYTYEGTYAVNPHDWSVFNYKGAPILTLQTCSGVFFQNRQMYQFSLSGFDKIKQS
ncbi:MAG: sortase [Candidatus Saccharimonadales bacterium]